MLLVKHSHGSWYMKNFQKIKKLLERSNYFYIITAGIDGNYSYVNQHYATQFKYIHEDFVGQPYHITMHEEDREICREVSIKCFENPEALFPAVIRKHDGHGGYLYTQWEYRAMLDDGGNPAGIFCLGYNITQFIAQQQLLNGAMNQIEEKSHLLEMIAFRQSHTIRAPLTNILSLIPLLQKNTKDRQLLSLCEKILESAINLDNAIRSIVSNIDDQE